MKATCTWTEKLQFISNNGTHSISMDAKKPIGSDTAPTPKDLLLSALCGCSGMDVVALMRKHKEPLESFHIDAEAEVRAALPAIYSEIRLTYHFKGALNVDRVKEAVRLSETEYCSVSAMLSKVVPIRYTVVLNGFTIDEGQANFKGI